MSVRGKALVHCHGRSKGKVIKRFKSHAKAMAAHRAIQAKKHSWSKNI